MSRTTARIAAATTLATRLPTRTPTCHEYHVGLTARGPLRTGGRRAVRRRTSGAGEFPAECGAARLQPRHGHAEGRAGHVVQPHLVEEVDRVRVAAVLAADAELQVGPGGPAPFDGDLDQPSDARDVQ